MRTVWIVQSDDYDQRNVDGVYSSLENAVNGVKASYGPPYSVTWEELKSLSDYFVLTGHFTQVQHYHYGGIEHFHIDKWTVDETKGEK